MLDRLTGASAKPTDRRPAVGLIGLDVSRPPLRLQTRSWIPGAIAVVVAGLALSALRMDVTRMKLALGESIKEELRLEEVERELTVAMRELRDPTILAERAAEEGFVRAERLIDLERPLESPPAAPHPDEIELAAKSGPSVNR